MRLAQAQDHKKPDIAGLRDNIDHIIVIYQENRSFDHYFGTYQNPKGGAVANLLNAEGKLDSRFTGLQKNPAGMAYQYLPVPDDIPGFQGAQLTNQPFHMAPYVPATHNVPWDPEHHFYRMYAEVDGGRMDQFVALALSRHHKPFDHMASGHIDATRLTFKESKPSGAVLGFYQREDIPDYHKLADNYVLFDHFFQAMSGGSTGNALYLAAGRSAHWKEVPTKYQGSLRPPFFDLPYDENGVLINDLPPVLGPTEVSPGKLKIAPPPEEQTYANIGDRLNDANVSWAWYNDGWNAVKNWAMKRADGKGDGSMIVDSLYTYEPHHNPFQYYPSWFDNVRAGRMRDTEDFFADVKKGELPGVSFLKATAENDEHPADSAPQWGMNWVMNLLRAVGDSPLWDKTAVVITYDEGGGLWDHMAPPRPDAYGCGTRIPALVVSPYAKPGHVDHHVADTTSVLAFIETRFKLDAMSSRDANAYNLMHAFDFSQSPRPPKFL
ncbi:phospholipase C [Salinisphaera sp. RV14]|uniref:phospholipase C n=1 Tax=Salinisphaera sp. RV14 TaxID=3454140 RepID=UPI003F829A2E